MRAAVDSPEKREEDWRAPDPPPRGAITFREALLHHYYETPLCSELMGLLEVAATAVRAMHAAGVEHGALCNDVILVRRDEKGAWAEAWIQAPSHTPATARALPASRRGRENAGFTLPSDLLRVFFEMQFAPENVPEPFLRAERRRRKRRAPFHREKDPGPRPYPPDPDIWIWDDRSMQAIPALRSRDKRKHYRKRDLLEMATASLRIGPGARRVCRELMAEAFTKPVNLQGRIGLSVNLEPERFEKERRWLAPMGPIPLLVRLYHHESEARRRFAIEAIRKLNSEGHKVIVALVQDRRAILFPGKWREFVDNAGAALSGFVEAFELGHAINRVKWGVWNYAEHRTLLEAFARWPDRYPQVPVIGPAGIDFEFPRVLPLMDHLPDGVEWDAFSHHLYVDRRGLPENNQAGYDTVRKLALARAIARVHPRCRERVIVSEVNWPLRGTGVWSPVGSPWESPGPRQNDPSVDEDTYAACMTRYLLLALCSGMADRVYWWNLAAHGFGLIDDRDAKGWRPRAAYHEFLRLAGLSQTATYLRREEAGDRIRLVFDRGGQPLRIEWDPLAPELPVWG